MRLTTDVIVALDTGRVKLVQVFRKKQNPLSGPR